MKRPLATVLALIAFSALAGAEDPESASLPAPGPENGGLRLRLIVATQSRDGNDAFNVQLDLMNTTDRPIILAADWPYDADTGDFREYFEACVSIETFPPIGPWQGQIMAPHRTLPQPQVELPPQGTLSLKWQACDRRLKNRVVSPLEVQNPRFPTDGLYSVHGVAVLRTPDDKHILRSNEQQVPIGGSQEMPKHAFGAVTQIDGDALTATVNLGTLHRIAVGDRFLLRTGMGDYWRLTVSRVEETRSSGTLAPADARGRAKPGAQPKLPERGTDVRLITD